MVTSPPTDWTYLKRAALSGLAAAVAGPVLQLAGTWTVAHPGIPAAVDSLLWTLGFFAGLLLLPLGLSFAAISMLRRQRNGMATGAVIAVGGMIGLPLMFALAPTTMRLRLAGYGALAQRMERTVSAIHSFEATNGRAPQRLDELAPQHLDRAPRLGKVRYVRAADGSGFPTFGNRWMLCVNAGFGLGFDSFVYLPNHQYPDQMLGGWPERVGAWAYVHE